MLADPCAVPLGSHSLWCCCGDGVLSGPSPESIISGRAHPSRDSNARYAGCALRPELLGARCRLLGELLLFMAIMVY